MADSATDMRDAKKDYYIPVKVIEGFSRGFACADDRFVLTIVSSGAMIVRVAGRTLSVTAPGCLCFNEREKPVIEHDEECGVTQVVFHPSVISGALTFENLRDDDHEMTFAERQDSDFLKPFIVREDDFAGFVRYGPGTNERIHELIANMRRELETKPDRFWPCRSRSYFLETVFLVFKMYITPPESPVQDLDGSQGSRIVHFINGNYDAKITVESLCEKFGVSHTTLNRIVRESSGMTVNKLINRTRISAACVMLRDTALPVVEIVYRTGFSDVSHFGRVFRNITGMSPGEYREKHGIRPGYLR